MATPTWPVALAADTAAAVAQIMRTVAVAGAQARQAPPSGSLPTSMVPAAPEQRE
jgi:hypothetical protein